MKNMLLLAGVSGIAIPSNVAQMGLNQLTQTMMAAMAGQATSPNEVSLQSAINEWKRLQQSDSYSFNDYATFLIAHPGWPGERGRRLAAEAAMDNGGYSQGLAAQFFTRFPPLTSTGRVRFAQALLATGQVNRANEEARAAWRAGTMRPDDETTLLGGFPGAITVADHDVRMDKLLWQGATSSATRELPYVSAAKRPVFAARLAFRTDDPNAGQYDAAVTGAARDDAGFVADRATWLRNNGQGAAARAYLAQSRTLSVPPGDVGEYFDVLLTAAQGAANDDQYALAYRIASQAVDVYPDSTDLEAQPYKARDKYTDLVWLAGQTALYQLGRPADAVRMFNQYSKPFATPQTRPKGLFWAGRAAKRAGEAATSKAYFERAAQFASSYYGQLAAEQLGVGHQPPQPAPDTQVPEAERNAFYMNEVVRAAQLLGTTGDYDDQTDFIRQIALDAKTADDHALAFQLSRSLGRPDLGVMLGRSALNNGVTDYVALGYPSVSVPASEQSNWIMVHAIARQESQFDPTAISHAGARGLMQLMPSTAREAASKLGLAYSSDSLTSDPQYNIQLGSTYFQRMLSYYGGSYPLAIAAYNAGPGNVNKWIAANGDPRLPSVDVVRWVEQIPFTETKYYVQRVLENAVVYDLLNPNRALSKGPDNMEWYLGEKPH